MITIATTRCEGQAPARPTGGRLLASIDVEWTKNYRIRNGNVPFCYSVTYLAIPNSGPVDIQDLTFQFTSRYVEDPTETGQLIASATAEIIDAFHRSNFVIGHQLSSDLAVLQAAGTVHSAPAPCLAQLQQARDLWKKRREPRNEDCGKAHVIDTRYDADHLMTGASRRLVDVCDELDLEVTQPELRGTSMTAVHRRWIERHDNEARERITVLNLRHSLSAALVALTSTGLAARQPVSVNRMLVDQLPTCLTWLQHPQFAATLTA